MRPAVAGLVGAKIGSLFPPQLMKPCHGTPAVCYAGAMPRFEPFSGLRYAPDLDLSQLICPPYDVVSPEEREKLAASHPANAIHVELPVEDGESGLDRYANAASLLDRWRADGSLVLDEAPAFYLLRMTHPDGRSTRGVIGALGCEPPGGDVLPHEETIPKDKSDRLDLLRACRANLSPIWGLSLAGGLAELFDTEGPAPATALDGSGVLHELWPITSRERVGAIASAVASSPVVIADGHHRYETALAYQAEQRSAGAGAGGHDLVMALVVELSADELSVRAIHRTLHGVPADFDLLGAFEEVFEATPLPGGLPARMPEVPKELVLVTTTGAWSLAARAAALEEARSDLDSSVVALAAAGIPGASTHHHHTPEAALAELRAGRADAAVLLRPVTVDQIAAWAHERRRMPPKSTYFHPKPATGLVFRLLGD